MLIGWNTSLLQKNLSGVGNYIEKILIEFGKTKLKDNLILFGAKNDYDYSKINLEDRTLLSNRIISKNKISRIIWEQSILPMKSSEKNIEILHCPAHVSPLVSSKKIILTIHDLAFKLLPKTFKLPNRIYLNNIVPVSIKKADKIIAVSKNTKKDIIEQYNIPSDKITVIYNGINNDYKVIDKSDIINKIKKKYNLSNEFILYLGTLEPRKNITNLIKAYSLYKSKLNNEIKLVIAGGKGWLYEDVFSLVEEKQLEEDVVFTGYVDEEDIVPLYNAATLFVYPSLYEGFGLPPLEAMACGTPVITSNVSSLPEVVGDAAITVDPHNINKLSQAINRILDNENLQNEMIQKGIERSKKFTWEKTARETIKIYEKVLNQKLL